MIQVFDLSLDIQRFSKSSVWNNHTSVKAHHKLHLNLITGDCVVEVDVVPHLPLSCQNAFVKWGFWSGIRLYKLAHMLLSIGYSDLRAKAFFKLIEYFKFPWFSLIDKTVKLAPLGCCSCVATDVANQQLYNHVYQRDRRVTDHCSSFKSVIGNVYDYSDKTQYN